MNIIFLGDSLTRGNTGVSYLNLLKQKLPNHELYNFGKNGDPVVSLYKRMKKIQYPEKIDIAFVWIGTNDVFVKVNNKFPVIKKILGQNWAETHEEFEEYYRKILDFLKDKTGKIFTVSPWIIGEDFKNIWNKELEQLSMIIKDISDSYSNVEYIDIRKKIFEKIKPHKSSDYIVDNSFGVIFDAITLNNPERIDKKSLDRGLFLTIDGVHLNNRSASFIADVFNDFIVKEMGL
jgi:lysophospholipase L1-like esterase